jgi:hypothetical protein
MNDRTRRNALIVGAIVLGLLSIGAGALIALVDDRTDRGGPNRTPSSAPSPTEGTTESPSATATPEPSESPILEDGRHFVYVTNAVRRDDGTTSVRFDLAYFYRGERAAEEAAQRGDEVVNDYYIVNENPRLRTLPLAGEVKVLYIPESACCDLQPGNIDAWLEAIREANPTDYAGTDGAWWLTVRGGVITRIAQQYLP